MVKVNTPWEAKERQFRDHIFLSQVAILFYILVIRASFIVISRMVNTNCVRLLFKARESIHKRQIIETKIRAMVEQNRGLIPNLTGEVN